MSFSSRQKRPLDRGKVEFRDSKLIIIATEGTCTEPQYFKLFSSPRVQIKVLPTENGKSDPQSVLARLKEFTATYDIHENDKLFVVIDRDRWTPKSMKIVASECAKNGVELAVSNPCFELWILMHFSDITADIETCEHFISAIQEKGGPYSKNKLDLELFKKENVDMAISRAKKHDFDKNNRWPQSIGTRVYRVVESICAIS
ncbi:MAG: RloB family protein [Leptospirales bacterium]